jgi:uncharacterized protein (TIGR02145 family)
MPLKSTIRMLGGIFASLKTIRFKTRLNASLWRPLTLAAGGIVFGLVCFLGKNFYVLGVDKPRSAVYAGAGAAALIALAAAAARLKRARKWVGICLALEIVSLLLFLGTAGYLWADSFSRNYFIAQNKTVIQKALIDKIDHAEKMFAEYGKFARISRENYGYRLDSYINFYNTYEEPDMKIPYEALFGAGRDVPDSTKKKQEMDRRDSSLRLDDYYKMWLADDPENAASWLRAARRIVSRWNPIAVADVVRDIDSLGAAWQRELKEFYIKGKKYEIKRSGEISKEEIRRKTAGNKAPEEEGLMWQWRSGAISIADAPAFIKRDAFGKHSAYVKRPFISGKFERPFGGNILGSPAIFGAPFGLAVWAGLVLLMSASYIFSKRARKLRIWGAIFITAAVIGVALVWLAAALLRENARNRKIMFETMESRFIDSRDRQIYKMVKIGGAAWMAQNLNYKADSSWCYDNADSNCVKYGRLYDWNTAMKVCPAGWHLPAAEEWKKMMDAVGGDSVAGKILKADSGWGESVVEVLGRARITVGNGTDDFGFSVLPGGYGYREHGGRRFTGAGDSMGMGVWWAAAEKGRNAVMILAVDKAAYPHAGSTGNAYSVRCAGDYIHLIIQPFNQRRGLRYEFLYTLCSGVAVCGGGYRGGLRVRRCRAGDEDGQAVGGGLYQGGGRKPGGAAGGGL